MQKIQWWEQIGKQSWLTAVFPLYSVGTSKPLGCTIHTHHVVFRRSSSLQTPLQTSTEGSLRDPESNGADSKGHTPHSSFCLLVSHLLPVPIHAAPPQIPTCFFIFPFCFHSALALERLPLFGILRRRRRLIFPNSAEHCLLQKSLLTSPALYGLSGLFLCKFLH